MEKRATTLNVIRVPVSSWITAREVLAGGDSFSGVSLEPIYILSAEQVFRLIQHGIPFEQMTREQLHAIQDAERQLTLAERHERAERLLREALEYRRKQADSAPSPRV